MKVLTLNCGSTSVKFDLIETDLERIRKNEDAILAAGEVEGLGGAEPRVWFRGRFGATHSEVEPRVLDHRAAIRRALGLLTDPHYGVLIEAREIEAVGHRVVHGGEVLGASVVITPSVEAQIERCIEFAPLHNGHNLRGIRIAREMLPDVPQVAAFDTGFHQTMPRRAYLYALPYDLYEKYRIRRYGFHGLSHRFVSFRAAQLEDRTREELKIISCHLGGGASVAAIDHGRCVDTSMGFTPTEGLVMGTRPGDLDPSLILYLMSRERLEPHEMVTMLNRQSGVYGLSGVAPDMRRILEAADQGNDRARAAVEVYAYRIKKYLAAYVGVLGGADMVVFTGGIGAGCPAVRALACEGLEPLGIALDQDQNRMATGNEARISPAGAGVRVYAMPTNEELVIARDTVRVLSAGHGGDRGAAQVQIDPVHRE